MSRLTPIRALCAVLAVWAAAYLLYLGNPEIKGEEGRRIFPAIAMLEGGSWVVPSVGGEMYYNKPPGINWLVAGSFVLTGQRDEFAARLPSALGVLALATLMALLPTRSVTPRARLLAALLLLTSVGMLEKGRLIEIDAVYSCFAGAAVVWWVYRSHHRPRGIDTWLVPSLLLAAGALVKGPFLAAAFYPVVAATLLYRRRLRDLWCWPHLLGIAAILGICLGWVALAQAQADAARMADIWSRQLARRFAPVEFGVGEWFEGMGMSFVLCLPTLLLVPLAFVPSWTRNVDGHSLAEFRGLRAGAVAGFALLLMMPLLEARYILPALPGLCLLAAWVFEAHRAPARGEKAMRIALLVGFAGVAVAVTAAAIVGDMVAAGVVLAIAAIVSAAVAFAVRKRITGGFAMVTALCVVIAIGASAMNVLSDPYRRKAERRRPAAAALDDALAEAPNVHVWRAGYEPFLYYVRHPVRYVVESGDIDAGEHMLLVRRRDLLDPALAYALAGRDAPVVHKVSERIAGRWFLLTVARAGP
jgi:4-amino-4-deoxy-L-arabinose transferase-like glycosyltransferase